MTQHQSNIRSQRGVALIMVLGMVAIIAAWASMAAYEDMIAIKRASNTQDEVRATMASESAFELVKLYLKEDFKLTGDVDSLDEDWALGLPPFPIDDGMIGVVMVDSNRYYNLNDLVDDNGVAIPKHVEQLQRLFTLLSIDSSLVDALVDWMDKDDKPYGTYGAEDAMYYDKDYKVKNARLDNLSELKLILGFKPNIIHRLKRVACVHPNTQNGTSKININTAPADVLMSLFPNLTKLDVETLAENMPYEDLKSIDTLPWVDGGDLPRLSVGSDTFTLRTHASFGRAQVREEYLLSRTQENVQLLWRERLGWQL
ncbi:MAG: type II secretion system minor pseudopilin GspK [Ghiorsea sp.]|nr:type II secretion system minor pseudopilin GspK [Ghiorsea sp.]